METGIVCRSSGLRIAPLSLLEITYQEHLDSLERLLRLRKLPTALHDGSPKCAQICRTGSCAAGCWGEWLPADCERAVDERKKGDYSSTILK